MKPLIGITKSDKGGFAQNMAIKIAVFLVGGKTVNLTPSDPQFELKIDALIISGGTDIHPSFYDFKKEKLNYTYDRSRDFMELEWLKQADKKNLPTLCICRGAQLLNIYFGGSLFFDISKSFKNAHYPSSLWGKIFFRKQTKILSGKLKKLFGKSQIPVNSLHTQAIARVGEDLKKTMMEENGVIQAVEHKKKRFFIGVQFHPEFLIYKEEFRRVFKALAQSCKISV